MSKDTRLTHQTDQATAQPRLPRTVENFPREALALGQMQVEMGKVDDDADLVRSGENLIRRAQEVLARQGHPKEGGRV